MVKDLVCGMDVNEKAAGYSMIFEDEVYFFCSEGCRAEFRRRPQDYLKPADDAACCARAPEKEENRNV